MTRAHRLLICSVALLMAPAIARCGATFQVKVDPSIATHPLDGRLVVYLINESSRNVSASPGDAPFFSDPQPMFGIDVANLKPGDKISVDDGATSFPAKPSAVPPGKYIAQAVLDMHRDDSRWQREPGNLYSDPVRFTVETGKSNAVELRLNKVVSPRENRVSEGVEMFETPSKLLSDFHGRLMVMRAGVCFPKKYDKSRAYPAIYEIGGFGDDASGVYRHARRASGSLAEAAFWIVPDPESGNGHTLFANSANNGPCGDALVRELIPALEKKYNLLAKPQARLLRGHSSGGWSTLWLQLQYPDVFGGAWSSSPDPVDFRKLQVVDIYSDANMYARDGKDLPSTRDNSMTIRQENQMEEVIGPGNRSGQQWDSWFAVWGSRGGQLFDPISGVIDPAEAAKYKQYDINELLKRDPQKYGPIFRNYVRLIVGDQDNFFLNEAVVLLKPQFNQLPDSGAGYVKILPGFDHGSIFMSPEMRAIPQEMLKQLQTHP